MNSINWKQKLASRKFWAAVAGFVTPLLIAFNVDSLTIEQVGAIITAGGALIAYILAEGNVDANRVNEYNKAEPIEPIELVYPEED